MNTTDKKLTSKTEAVAVVHSSRSFWRVIPVVFWSAYAGIAFYVGIEQLLELRPKSGCLLLVIGGVIIAKVSSLDRFQAQHIWEIPDQ